VTESLSPEDRFYLQYGKALDAWASLELELSGWFEYLTGMPPNMARAIFYSGNGFATRQSMISSALKAADEEWAAAGLPGQPYPMPRPLDQDVSRFLDAAITRAGPYSSARNSIAHQMFVKDETGGISLADRGKWWSEAGLTIDHLREIELRFTSLRVILARVAVHVRAPLKIAFQPHMTPQEGLRQVCELPPKAHTPLSTRNSAGHQRQPQSPPRKNREPKLSSAQRRERALRPKDEPPP
jgi:hypothetical protein